MPTCSKDRMPPTTTMASRGRSRAGGVLSGGHCRHLMDEELLVGLIQLAAASLGLGSAFFGVFVVPNLGNAAEHATANPNDTTWLSASWPAALP
jgi:Ca2+/H+ antiporter